MNINACIFDFDGTLVDTLYYHYESLNYVLSRHGGDLTYDDYIYKYNGQKAQTVMLELFPWTDSATLSWYLQEKTNRYHTLIENYGITPLDGVIDFLEYLHKNCIKCGIASSSRSAKFVAEKSWIAQYMQVTVTGNDIKNSKPDPEIFLLAADRLGVSYQNCVVFEDASSGIKGAKNAGMYTVGLQRSNDTGVESADIVVYSLSDYQHIIDYFHL